MAIRVLAFGLGIVLYYYCLSSTRAAITQDSISDFGIGLLFASHDLESVCMSPVHFVMAKRRNSGACRWRIPRDFVKQAVSNETGLPVVDINKDCLFSCNYKSGEPKLTAELQMLPQFSQNSSSLPMSDYDLYTYLALCERTIRGNISQSDWEKVNSTLTKFSGVYFTSNFDRCPAFGEEVLNDNILHKDSATGLIAARKNTKVNVDIVQEVIKGNSEESALKGEDKKAYDAYIRQHPYSNSTAK